VILVTGGTGFIGRHLVPALVSRQESVRVLVRDEERAKGLPASAERARGDIADPGSLVAALAGVRAVVHLAAVMDGVPDHASGMQAANVEGSRGLARVAASAGVEHFVHVSSAGVYGSRYTPEPFTERDEPEPSTAYERTKLAAERAVRDEAPAWTVLRPTGVFGPGRAQTEAFLRTVQSRRLWLFGGTDTLFNPVYVGDVVAAVLMSLEKDAARGEVINVGGDRVVSYRDLVGAWARALGTAVYRIRIPRALTQTGAGVAGGVYAALGRSLPARVALMAQPVINRAVTTEKARRFGVAPTPLETALSATIEQMRAGRRA